MKKRSAFDISDAVEAGFNEFHRECGYHLEEKLKIEKQEKSRPLLTALHFLSKILVVFR